MFNLILPVAVVSMGSLGNGVGRILVVGFGVHCVDIGWGVAVSVPAVSAPTSATSTASAAAVVAPSSVAVAVVAVALLIAS